MGLDESTIGFIGRLLAVTPVYGWGWSNNAEEPAPPAPFRVRVTRLWFNSGERRGGVGTIEEPGHANDGTWLLFSTRHVGTFNFTTLPGMYNVSISSAEPVDNDDGWPVAVLSTGDASGYAEIIAIE